MSQAQAQSATAAIKVRGLSAVLGGQKVLDVPSMQVHPGEVLMIIGPNGSGKTTLLLCLASLLRPAAGAILYHGTPAITRADILRLRRHFAVVFQEPLLLNSSVWDNVTLGLKMRGVKGQEMKARADKWLQRFGISHLAKRQARLLSGGEARRVSLVRAFVLQPEILFLDEPFNALDSPTRRALLEDFESVLRETSVTTVMVTHDRNEALALGSRMLVVMNGSIRQTGTPEEVFASPADEEVAAFVEAGNLLRGSVTSQSGGLATIDVQGKLLETVSDLEAGKKVTVLLGFDDVTLTKGSPEEHSTSARNHLAGEIVRIFPMGSQARITVDCGFKLSALVTRRTVEEMGLKPGMKVCATFKATAVHVIERWN
jgi:tungstate transport system ATP-binding protein